MQVLAKIDTSGSRFIFYWLVTLVGKKQYCFSDSFSKIPRVDPN